MRILNGLRRFGVVGLLTVAAALSSCQTTSGTDNETKVIGPNFHSTVDPSVASGDPRLARVAHDLAGVWHGSASGAGTGGLKITLAIENVTKGSSANTLKAKGYTASERSGGLGRLTDIDIRVADSGYNLVFETRAGHVEAHSITQPGVLEGQISTGRIRADLSLVKASD